MESAVSSPPTSSPVSLGLYNSRVVKRKTPSELRAEQLERGRLTQDDIGQTSRQYCYSKNVEAGKSARLIDTRVADVYAATKPGERPPKILPFKDLPKVGAIGHSKSHDQTWMHCPNQTPPTWVLRKTDVPSISISRPKFGNLSCPQAQTVPCFTFKSVTELSLLNTYVEPGSQRSEDQNKTSPLVGKKYQVLDAAAPFECSLRMTLSDAPLDFSLKNSARLVSSNSLHWCHRISTRSQCHGLKYFMEMSSTNGFQTRTEYESLGSPVCDKVPVGAYFWDALHSWVYPQSTLPPRTVSAANQGTKPEQLFYVQRNRMWEAAFQSLYFMFRKKLCSIFYVCTQQFVVMFVGGLIGGRHKEACSAFLTRSTCGLRGLLRAQDLQFTMPLLEGEEGVAVGGEFLELNESEKIMQGQARSAVVDNSMSSILAFDGPKNVHRLYDFLLNQRFLLSSSASADVPTLLSPVPFEHGTLSKPELICKQVQLPDKSVMQEAQTGCGVVDLDIMYTVDLKGMLLPHWVISRICNVLRSTQPTGFEISFSTDSLTEGLNVAQKASYSGVGSAAHECSIAPGSYTQGVPYLLGLGKASVKHVMFRDHSYFVSLAIPSS